MAKHSILPRLDDIFGAIAEVEVIIAGLDLNSYKSSVKERRAVEWCVEIVSEATRHIPPEMTSNFPDIPWHDIRGIGNRLRHEYQRVDDGIIWLVASKSLPELKPVIQQMIAHLESDASPES